MAKFLWTQRSDFGPGPRASHAMTFDSQRGRTVLFGGDSGNAVLGDTWEWDGSFWTQMDDSGPGPRADHAMVYDSARQVSILFGGRDTGQTLFGDTWQWDGLLDPTCKLRSDSALRPFNGVRQRQKSDRAIWRLGIRPAAQRGNLGVQRPGLDAAGRHGTFGQQDSRNGL